MLASRDKYVTKKFQKRLNKRPKFEHAESRNSSMSRVPLASAEAKFRRGGHGSQAMPNNSKWYSMFFSQIGGGFNVELLFGKIDPLPVYGYTHTLGCGDMLTVVLYSAVHHKTNNQTR